MDKKNFTIVCRGSWLSRAQAEIFTRRIQASFPDITTTILIRETAGDKNLSTPLHLVEGKDFFTREIQDTLRSGEADFALHSMKDVSSETFFSESRYAIINREPVQDIAIFNPNVIEKIANGLPIVLGTSSPRRSNMATAFLESVLPNTGQYPVQVTAASVRGNVDARLQKLNAGEYDGLVLAVAGLNRLLQFEPAAPTVRALLANKKMMVLPLFECPPAAGQGAIVAETNPDNLAALNLLKAIGDAVLTKGIQQERIYAEKYGYGCSQQFGVFHWQGGGMPFTFASGTDSTGKTFSEWDFHLPPTAAAYHWLDTTKFMKDFFRYEYPDTIIPDHYAGYFVASHKAVHNPSAVALLHKKRVWVAGTRTWRELAARGIWVEGCADGLGMETLTRLLHTPLIDLPDMHVLTNTDSAQTRIAEGHSATGTYILIPAISPALVAAITGAEAIFWSSFRQYASFAHLLPRGIPQACAAGKTADALRAAGVRPIVFPTLKAFQEWQQQYVLLPVGE